MSLLFEPLSLRSVTLRNRIGIAPMCQYSATDGLPTDWHLVHLGARATGGAGLILSEATAVVPEGRITPGCTGIWSSAHVEAWKPITRFLADHGAVPGIQLAHAGRKASTAVPWEGGAWLDPQEGGWIPEGPSAVPYAPGAAIPQEMSVTRIGEIVAAFAAGARRAIEAGFQAVEVHAAHGYLLHGFLSPRVNHRTDAYGGDRVGRMRLVREVTAAVRAAVGDEVPVLVRISASDWVPDGWTPEDSVVLAQVLREAGADLIDCSSGGAVPDQRIDVGWGYQVPFAARLRAEAGVPTAAVGMITSAEQAEQILADGGADLILFGRESLRDPAFALHAAHQLDDLDRLAVPPQYGRAWSRPRGAVREDG
ncbi:MAG: NADH:flavin oxidoreductase/NADH oxidase [Nitriliruptoraceae bacterium]|nr:NADH:flavin oxidoreductase/NADH oxidase [Nitriliruptoraceae bacterium]